MMKRLKITAITALVTALMAAPAMAWPVIDFHTGLAGEGGSISWDGTNLVGSDIPIGGMFIVDSDSADGVYLVSGTASGSGGGMYGSLDFDTSASWITVTGCIPGLSIGTVDADGNCTAPETLMSGTIEGWDRTHAHNGLISAFGEDTKHELLVAAVGIPQTLPWEFFGFAITTRTLNPDGTPGAVISSDIRNTPVPEPATMILLGSGLLAAFRARRRTA
jgi:hypothetical protein